jgi:hypothetical protein
MVCPDADRLMAFHLNSQILHLNSALSIFTAFTLLTAWSMAELPQKPPLNRYTRLWSDSPFTSKPPPAEQGPQANLLDDYALIGISPIGSNNYRVTLINKKQPDERITVDSNSTRSDFKILGVTRKQGDPLGTVVKMSSGSMIGTVTFDEKLLTLTTPQAAVPTPQQAGQPQPVPAQPPGLNGQPQPQPQRQPRPRVVPPPSVTQPTNQAQPTQGAQPNIRRTERRRN